MSLVTWLPFLEHKPKSSRRGVQPELNTPALNYKTSDKAFQAQIVQLWKALPPFLRHLPLFASFKRAVRQYLVDRDPTISILWV